MMDEDELLDPAHYHESAHALAFILLCDARIREIRLGENGAGRCRVLTHQAQPPDLYRRALAILGGPASEEVFYGAFDMNANSTDLTNAGELLRAARRPVIRAYPRAKRFVGEQRELIERVAAALAFNGGVVD